MIIQAGDLGIELDTGTNRPGSVLQRYEARQWRDNQRDGKPVRWPVKLERLAVYLRPSSVFDSLAGGSPLGLWSPSVDLAGQTLNTGHFLQPTAMATGQSVMGTPRTVCPFCLITSPRRGDASYRTPGPPFWHAIYWPDPTRYAAKSFHQELSANAAAGAVSTSG